MPPNEQVALLIGLLHQIREADEATHTEAFSGSLISPDFQQQFDIALSEIIDELADNQSITRRPTVIEQVLRILGRDLAKPVPITVFKPMFEGKKSHTGHSVSSAMKRINQKLNKYGLKIKGDVHYWIEKSD